MKKLNDLRKFEISSRKAKEIKGGNLPDTFCYDMIEIANEILASGFVRCPEGCEEEKYIWMANACSGREPWDNG